MDAIGFAMQKGAHIPGMEKLQRQCWKIFEEEAAGKKVVVFGTGACLSFYLEKYREHAKIDIVIDNDAKKQGYYLDQLVPEAFGITQTHIMISDMSILKQYTPNEIVILVASINYYEEILEQLSAFGITDCFAVLIMEAKSRIKIQKEEAAEEEQEKRCRFAGDCCKDYPIENKKIYFRTYGKYTDHQKYITESLLKIRADLDIVWEVSDLAEILPDRVRKIYSANWMNCIYEMETSKVWVFDLAAPSCVVKRPEQIYIQTKHWASITLKKFYLDAATFRNTPELTQIWKRESQIIDHIITGSDFDTESCRRGFEFQGEVLQYGSPRSDALFHEKVNRSKIYEYFQLEKSRKSMIYAPTYRFDKTKGKGTHESREIELDFERIKNALKKRFGGEWYIFIRLHPSVATAFQGVKRPDFVIDVSLYSDSQELVSAADIMVSDFSSIMFEPAFVKKPVFLFTTDLQDYQANEYELLIQYDELPFPIAESNAGLEQCIAEFDPEAYQKNVETFFEKYGVCEDGHASERAAAFISDLTS